MFIRVPLELYDEIYLQYKNSEGKLIDECTSNVSDFILELLKPQYISQSSLEDQATSAAFL